MTNPKPQQISVSVSTRFLEDQSSPETSRYAFAYHVVIRNEGDLPAQLISRHWIITDSDGHVQEVRGIGVVGEQPWLSPGEAYEYTSGCVIDTPVGTMQGSYQMIAEDGIRFDATIPEFVLAAPRQLH